MKIKALAVAVATLISFSGVQALADDVMTEAEMQAALIGNSVQYSNQWGIQELFRDTDGTFYHRNSKGERGKGNWKFSDGKLCMTYTEKHYDWLIKDYCSSYTRVDETTIKSGSGNVHKIFAGDPSKVKP